ncbi:MAG: Diphthamide biosynthesis methyltransferase DPH5 [Candidatus Methanohalarchaeum thermophilum]|uniref:Diphthine synthase n=1 Tax=Methanohalarchaeum thermophilum TaxID=1903181 RepID=A0A1Q6DU36_METT1|nr:MAG: Diphthamide biosynthesis methyltransferase DPH5 [Candidatus Methanohalarchaeum thermophilum]
MSLYFIGLGLYDEKSISVRGLEEAKDCDKLFAEFYTSKLMGSSLNDIENLIDSEIICLSRDKVERSDLIVSEAEEAKVGFLVGGDPMISTTHVDLRLDAIDRDVDVRIIHGTSIYTAAPGLAGLQNYKFGRSATLTFPRNDKYPRSAFNAVKENRGRGLHTLLFLDLEEDGNFLSPSEGLEYLMEVVREEKSDLINLETVCVVVGRAGSSDPELVVDEIGELIERDFNQPMYILIVPGDLHFREEEALDKLKQV